MSMATTPAFAAAGGHYNQQQHLQSRGTSPFRSKSNASNRHDHGYEHQHQSHHHHSKSPMRTRSLSPFGGREGSTRGVNAKKQNVMVCHESAHAIVFRDHLRLARKIIQEVAEEEEDEEEKESGSSSSDEEGEEGGEAAFQNMQSLKSSLRESVRREELSSNELTKEINLLAHDLVPELKTVTLDLKNVSERNIEIEGLHAHITPLDELEWRQKTDYKPLLESSEEPTSDWSEAEKEVFQMLKDQQASVKTIQKNEWPTFLARFQQAKNKQGRGPALHDDMGPDKSNMPFNSFVTSTSLLPSCGKKMRCYGSEQSYPIGVVFGLPKFASQEEENEAVKATETWAWPAGYAAKTEFNIDNRGKLINGRQEALVSLEQIRQYNHDYLTKSDHYIAGRIIKGGFSVVPYNEIFLRVGGPGRLVDDRDVVTGQEEKRSLTKGCGLFVALFIRTTTMGDIINLLRTRARIGHILGMEHVQNIPLLYLHNEHGIRVFTKSMQLQFWCKASCLLQPFANPALAMTTKYKETNDKSLQFKHEELLPLDNAMIQELSHHELAKIAGGFGVTDTSFLQLLQHHQSDFQHVHDIMQQGFAAVIRANDYYTGRQLLILYALANTSSNNADIGKMQERLKGIPAASYANLSVLKDKNVTVTNLPAPLATKRWRRATNSHGILVVLGAAQILKTITTASAKRRTEESYVAVEEWVHHGEESVAFRVASWREQRADEADANIAMSTDSKFMAFVTNKSVHNRRKFAQQLRKAAPEHNYTGVGFLQVIYDIVDHMHSPCMRLELLQYILALDNRYSVELIKDSIELAATCLSVVS